MKVQKSLNKIGKKLSREQLLSQLKMRNIKGGKGCPPPNCGMKRGCPPPNAGF